MRKFVFVLAAAGATLVMSISLASAQTSRGMQSINSAKQILPPYVPPLAKDGAPGVVLATSSCAAAGDVGAVPATDSRSETARAGGLGKQISARQLRADNAELPLTVETISGHRCQN
jgi:hypothetical protein